MTEAASLTPVGDWLDRKYGGRISTHALGNEEHPAGCGEWHTACAYLIGRAEAMRQLAADLEAEASAITGQDEPPRASRWGLEVTSGTEAAAILRRAAQLARQRAERRPQAPGPAASVAPQRAVRAGDMHDDTTEGERP